jgi:hypothetical protein
LRAQKRATSAEIAPAGPRDRSLQRPGALAAPAIVVTRGSKASKRFLESFAATIRDSNTRAAYDRADGRFLAWCEDRGLTDRGRVSDRCRLPRFGDSWMRSTRAVWWGFAIAPSWASWFMTLPTSRSWWHHRERSENRCPRVSQYDKALRPHLRRARPRRDRSNCDPGCGSSAHPPQDATARVTGSPGCGIFSLLPPGRVSSARAGFETSCDVGIAPGGRPSVPVLPAVFPDLLRDRSMWALPKSQSAAC